MKVIRYTNEQEYGEFMSHTISIFKFLSNTKSSYRGNSSGWNVPIEIIIPDSIKEQK